MYSFLVCSINMTCLYCMYCVGRMFECDTKSLSMRDSNNDEGCDEKEETPMPLLSVFLILSVNFGCNAKVNFLLFAGGSPRTIAS